MPDDLPSLFAYNRWADDRVLAACRALDPARYAAPAVEGWSSVRATLVHLAGALDVWARRFGGENPTALPAEADYPTLDAVAALFARGHAAIAALLPALTPERLDAPLTYLAFAGGMRTLPLWAAYRHVVNHATYHRGQVASKLKRLGVEPPSTDLAVWAASGAAR